VGELALAVKAPSVIVIATIHFVMQTILTSRRSAPADLSFFAVVLYRVLLAERCRDIRARSL